MSNKKTKTDWTPEGADEGFATFVVDGARLDENKMPFNKSIEKSIKKRAKLNFEDYKEGVLSGNRTRLAQAITLVESASQEHLESAQKLIKEVYPFRKQSIRIGITGVPGAGKSTLIETFGLYLCNKGHKVAVLAIDPSSTVTGGSILGDKTRMEMLSRNENAFIRPSPSGGNLGGVARKTRETMLLCEAAGYDVILVETVGVGQSETTVRSMVDFFLLILVAGAGDELQGIKRGVVELADSIYINKADGDNVFRANLAKSEYEQALHYLGSPTEGWRPVVGVCSAYTGDGVESLWATISNFVENTKKSSVFDVRRQKQMRSWVYSLVDEYLIQKFYNDNEISNLIQVIESKVSTGKLPPTEAAQELLKKYFKNENLFK